MLHFHLVLSTFLTVLSFELDASYRQCIGLFTIQVKNVSSDLEIKALDVI
jgi:hypothetical protein